MKKLLLVVAIVAASFTANAQETTFGATAGFNSTITTATASVVGNSISASTSASGFYVGFFADFELSDSFSVQPELQYVSASQNGGSINQLVLPIMAKYNVSEKFSVQAGPVLDLMLDKVPDGFKTFGLGLGLGLGYDFTEDIFATSRYSFGLTNRVDTDAFSSKIGFFQIGLGYRF